MRKSWFIMRELRSNICLLLWLYLCLLIYLLLPNKPHLVAQQVNTMQLRSAYNEQPQQLIDLHNFDYLINQAPCESHVQMLIMIHSAPANLEKRTAIRATWGSESMISGNSTLRLLFLFGRADNEDEQLQLLQEQGLYGDVLQGNFRDAYFNLSYKHVMALKWFDNHCHMAQLLLKVDDDIYVNTPLLLQGKPALLHQHQPRELLLCARQDNARVLRSYSSKWRVSFREYADRFYPPFCPGFAVVYSANVVHRLYGAAQRSSFFRLDDVFVTGLLAKRCNISITDLTSYVLYPQELQTLLSVGRVGSVGAQQREFLVSWHKMSAQQIKELWLLDGKNNASKLMRSIERARAAKSLNSL